MAPKAGVFFCPPRDLTVRKFIWRRYKLLSISFNVDDWSISLWLCMSATLYVCMLPLHTATTHICRCSEQTALLPALKGPSLSIAKATSLRHQGSVCLTACCSLLLAKHCTSQQGAHHTRHTHRHTCSCTHTCAHLHTPTAKHEDDSFSSILS